VSDRWVVNASPIILLAKAGQISLLLQLAGEVVVPASVARKIQAGLLIDPTLLHGALRLVGESG
jgi:predicted nucleic acid-binding protein